jgi:RHS repeat-associated protein
MRFFHPGSRSRLAVFAVMASTCFAAAAFAAGDVEDQFFRYIQRNHKVFAQELPGESVDPFTGILRVVQVDVALPGKAGLDLQILRTYNSKIWGRTDALDMDPLLAEKQHSPLGYGWSMHMGRVKNPFAAGELLACHQANFPIYEAPDGTARVFYPVTSGSTVLQSKDFWRMEKNCGGGICIWSDKGIRYEFSSANQYFYGTTPVWPLSRIVDPFNNQISVTYVAGHGEAIDRVTDTYTTRQIAFLYDPAEDGLRLNRMIVNGATYLYTYTTYTGAQTGGAGRIALPGTGRLFLTGMKPPIGPGFSYSYAFSAPVAQNQYALSGITYPQGGTTTYGYGTSSFYTGSEFIPFAVVTQRTLGGRAVTPGAWTYGYSSPGPGAGLQTATIQRPDGRTDSYSMYGFGYVAGKNATGFAWMAGLTQQISRGGGAEVETFAWDSRSATPVTAAYPFGTPMYSPTAQCPVTAFDNAVYAPAMTQHTVARDGATYTSALSNLDAYGQPRTVVETGPQARTTTWTYFSATLNMLRGFPLSQHVCMGTDCFDNSWTYNAANGARDMEKLSGVTTTFGYDALGNLSTVTNALGKKLTLSSYSNGVPTVLNFDGSFTNSRTVSFEGWIQSETDGRLNRTDFGYDVIGRLKTVTPPGINSASSYAYALDDSSVTLTRGSYSQTSTLDGLGRVTATSDSEGVLTSTAYDALGRVTFKSYPYDSVIKEVGDLTTLDGLGRPLTVKKAWRPLSSACDDANGCTTTYSYSGNCVTTSVQRKLGEAPATRRCSSSFGNPDETRLTSVLDANARTWSYAYSAHGDPIAVTAPTAAGNRSYTYFATTNFLKSETTAEQFNPQATTQPSMGYTRNALGQPLTRTDARSIAATLAYDDPLSRLTSVAYPQGILSASRGQLFFDYDDLNRATQERWTFGGQTYTTTVHYNANGCTDSVTYPTGTVLTQTCDTANRVKTISIGTSSIVSGVTYHPSGQPKAMAYGNAKSTAATFDDRGRVKTTTSSGAIDLAYTYDGADNVKSFNNLAVPGSSRTMTYDNLDRLLTATAPSLWGTATYDYDDRGNRTLNSYNGFTATYAYDAHNRLATATAGRFRDIPMRFSWDASNHLATSSDGASYFYDGMGRRIQKTDASGTTLYHYDPAGKLIAETTATGQKLRDYIYLAGKLVAVDGCVSSSAPPCSERQWYHSDRLGSVLALTDTSGLVTGRHEYKPWGEQWSSPALQSDRQFNGRVYDRGTGFHDYGARLYWPQIGRFIGTDTAGADLRNPISLNRYSYTFDNPYKYTDPDGHLPFLVVTGLAGAVGGGIYGAISSANSSDGFTWRAVLKWGAVGGVAGLTLGAGTGLALGVGATATAAEIGTAGAALLGIGGTAVATKGQQAMTTLYHGGELIDGAVQSRLDLSTTPVFEHALQYAESSGGQVYRFEVPTRWLMEMARSGRARTLQDLLKGTTDSALEWRFYGEAAAKMNEYLVPASSGAAP